MTNFERIKAMGEAAIACLLARVAAESVDLCLHGVMYNGVLGMCQWLDEDCPLGEFDDAVQNDFRPTVRVMARPAEEWDEDYGDVLWWKFPIEEPPYVGSPLDCDWTGYHTHWTPIVVPEPYREVSCEFVGWDLYPGKTNKLMMIPGCDTESEVQGDKL